MASQFLIYANAYALAATEFAPCVFPGTFGRSVGFPPYDNGFNLWPESIATVVLGVAFCRNAMGQRRAFLSSRKAAEFIHAC